MERKNGDVRNVVVSAVCDREVGLPVTTQIADRNGIGERSDGDAGRGRWGEGPVAVPSRIETLLEPHY